MPVMRRFCLRSFERWINAPEKVQEMAAPSGATNGIMRSCVEKSKKAEGKISVPVLFGLNGKPEKYFEADGYSFINKTVIEVEAGRAVTNYQFLKDLFQACMMYDVDYLIIAVRQTYSGNKDFEKVINFIDTLYTSGRLSLPLNGILIIGY